MANQCEARSLWFAAAFHWAQLTRIDPALGEPHYRRGLVLTRLGRTSDADQEFKVTLQLRTTLPPQTVADCHAMLGQLPEAAKLYQEAAALPTATPRTLQRSALLRLGTGDLDGYRMACKTLILRFGKTKNEAEGNNVAWACANGSDALADLKPAIDLAQQAVKWGPKTLNFHGTLGAVMYRAGQHAEAVTELKAAIRMQGKGGSPHSRFFLAMAQHRLGKADEAKKSLEQAEKLLAQDPAWFWTDKLERQLLHREAVSLIRSKEKDEKK